MKVQKKDFKMTPEVVIIARLTGVGITKPRRRGAHILWAADNQEQMEELRKEKAETDASFEANISTAENSVLLPSTVPSAPIAENTSSNPDSAAAENPTVLPLNVPSASTTETNAEPSHSSSRDSGGSATQGDSNALSPPVGAPGVISTPDAGSRTGSGTKKTKKKKKKGDAGDQGKDEEEGKKRRKSNRGAADFQAAASRGYDTLSPEEKELWEDLSEEDFESRMSEYVNLLTGDAPTSPESRQRYTHLVLACCCY